MRFVIDNSVAMAWCFEGEETPATAALLEQTGREGAIAPWLWLLEAGNTLLVAERRGRINAEQRLALVALLRDLPISLDAEGVSHTWNDILDLAVRHRLTMYDAVYLELAHRLQVPLATLDAELRSAATTLGVPLLGVGP